MAIKEKLNHIISQLTGDNADALKQELREAILEADNITEALTQANAESKARKEKLRTIESELNDVKEALDKTKSLTPELETYKKKAADYDAYLSQQRQTRLADWNKKASIFNTKETDKLHGKLQAVKDKFVFAPDDKTELTDEQVSANMRAYELLEVAGFFKAEDDNKGGFPRPANNDGNNKATLTSGQALFKSN
jgi:predicted RNase H-like nuclease (RuvC/YqgF family)